MARIPALFLCALAAGSLISCSTASSGRLTYNLAGVWIGSLGANCVDNCFPRPEISFTLFQQPSGISGFYRCWLGSKECPDPDEGGRVSVLDLQSAALFMRVTMKDGSRCLFQGLPDGDEIKGGRICYSSYGSIRNGWWRVHRAY
jgi:hypothetical protein